MADLSIEERLQRLEERVFGVEDSAARNDKIASLSELSHSTLLKNGQYKITAIVGYNELVKQEPPMTMSQIKASWVQAKFPGKADPKLLARAIVDGLVRDPLEDKHYDLTRKGEELFSSLMDEHR